MAKISKQIIPSLLLAIQIAPAEFQNALRQGDFWHDGDEYLRQWNQGYFQKDWPRLDLSTNEDQIHIQPHLGYNHIQHLGDLEDLGLSSTGKWRALNYKTDLQIHIFQNQSGNWITPDGEFIEFNTTEKSNPYQTITYSRLRSLFSLNTAVGKLEGGRDVLHWGPSFANGLIFSRQMIPFPFLQWNLDFSKIQLKSLVAEISDDGSFGNFSDGSQSTILQAHRIFWTPHPKLGLGLSESLLSQKDWPKLGLIPVVPLFAEKGQGVEAQNNGNLAVDAQWRLHPSTRLYSEFLIDDLESITSLFNDHWKSKWGLTSGFDYKYSYPMGDLGFLFEFTRIEPWVYTHHQIDGPKYTNKSQLLASAYGPGRLSFFVMPRWISKSYTLSLGQSWIGTTQGKGSQVSDIHIDSLDGLNKNFPHDLNWKYHCEPQISVNLWQNRLQIQSSWLFGDTLTFKFQTKYTLGDWQLTP